MTLTTGDYAPQFNSMQKVESHVTERNIKSKIKITVMPSGKAFCKEFAHFAVHCISFLKSSSNILQKSQNNFESQTNSVSKYLNK